MNRNLTLLLILLFDLFVTSAKAKEIICHLEGRVINRTSKAVFLMKVTTDPRSSFHIKIPIVDGIFRYKLIASAEEAYRLIFDEELAVSAFKPIIIFPDSAAVHMKLYSSEEADTKNEIRGGRLNRAYKEHMTDLANVYKTSYLTIRQKRKDAIAAKSYYTAAYDSLLRMAAAGSEEQRRLYRSKMIDLKKEGRDLSPHGKEISLEEQEVVKKAFIMRYDYIRRNLTPVSYFMLYDDLSYSAKDLPIFHTLAPSVYDVLSKTLPGHPYNLKAGYLVRALKLQAGQPLIDFQAPDLGGEKFQFSTFANGKVTLLNLWASWCGPCINKTRELMPIYDRYKERGLQVIGVAREFKDQQNLIAALAREKHPWLTLIDLEDENLIWDKYGLSNSGGAMVLIDAKGRILAMNPTIAEIEQLLKVELQ